MNCSGIRHWAVSGAFYLVVVVVFTWPILLHLDSRVIGDIDHPGLKGDLFYQYDLQRQMLAGQFPSHQHLTLFRHPGGSDTGPRDSFALHLNLYVLLMTVFGLLAAHNIATLLILLFNALAMHALIWERTRRLPLALMSGLLFAFGPYVMLKAQQGFTQKICIFTVPLFIMYLLRIIENNRARDHLLCVLALVLTLAIFPPYAVFSMLFAALFVAPMVFRRGPGPLIRVAPLFAVAAVLFSVVALMQLGDQEAVLINMSRCWESGGFLDIAHPLRWYPYEFTFKVPPAAFIPKLAIGFPFLVSLLALLAAVKRRSYARLLWIPVVAFLVIMAGPYLPMRLPFHRPDASALKLPFYYLAGLPGAGAWRFPIRMYPWILAALLLAAAEGARWLEAPERLESLPAAFRSGWFGRALPHLSWLLLALVVFENQAVFPDRLSVTEPAPPEFYEEIRDEPFRGLLLLPLVPDDRTTYMYAAFTSGKALANSIGGGPPMMLRFPPPHATAAQRARYLKRLAESDVRYIVVYLEFIRERIYYDRPASLLQDSIFGWLDPLCGPARIYPDKNMAVYDLANRVTVPGSER